MISADRVRPAEALRVQFGVGSLPRDCRVVDVSEGGARIIVENLDIPGEYTIVFSEGRRQCRLAWWIGCEFGAEFIDQDRYLAANS